MVVKKEELLGFMTEEEKKELVLLEEKINKALNEQFAPGGRVIVNLDRYPGRRVELEISRRCQEAGWWIGFHSNQKEGVWIELR